MPLMLDRAHEVKVLPDGNARVVKSNPYRRLVAQNEPPVIIQKGAFWSDGGQRIQIKDVPDWARKTVDGMTQAARHEVGLPPDGLNWDGDEPEAAPQPEESSNFEENSEVAPLSVVDAVYQLDPANDDHWTKDGKPNLDVVKRFRNLIYASRAEVEELTDGYRRPKQEV